MITDLSLDPRINDKPDRLTWNFNEDKKKDLQKEITKKMKLWNIEYERYKDEPDKIDQLVEYFQLLITTTAQEVLRYKRYNGNNVNWVDSKVYEILKSKKKIKNKISHLLHQMKKHVTSIKYAPILMKRQLKKFKQKLNKEMKKTSIKT